MLKHIFSVAAFMLVSFAVQGLSHFVINKAHYGAIHFMRADPIMPMGLLAMIIEGFILSFALAAWRGKLATPRDGLILSAAFGLFLVSYIALAAPAKYAVPAIQNWMMIESLAGFVQFTVYGLLLGMIHQRFTQNIKHQELG